MTDRAKDTLIALWIVVAGATFVALPFVAFGFPVVAGRLLAVGRGVYAVAAVFMIAFAAATGRSLGPRARPTPTRG